MSMIDHHDEPLWVGMDVDAELARLDEEDRREDPGPPAPRPPRRSSAARALRAASSTIGRGAIPRFPLQA